MKQAPVCGCGAGICRLDVVSIEGPNFGRRFYVCPIKKGQGACRFFMWRDADSNLAAPGLKVDESSNSVNISRAGSGICNESQVADSNLATQGLKLDESALPPVSICTKSININPADSDLGKKSQDPDSNLAARTLNLDESAVPPVSIFTNSININPADGDPGKESQDADSNLAALCLKLEESAVPPASKFTNSINTSPADSDIGNESQPINFGQERAFQCSNTPSLKSGLLKRNNFWVVELMGSGDILDEPLTRQSKRIRQGGSESDEGPSSFSSVSQFIQSENTSRNCLTLSPRRFEKDIHNGQMGSGEKHQTNEETTSSAAYEDFFPFRHHSSTILIDYEILRNTCWMLAVIRENLQFQIKGWWGRLAFPPSKCLTEPAPKPFFCCIFPSFDPIAVPPKVCQLDETAALAGTIVPESACIQPNSVMKKFVSEAFIKAGEQIQTYLLNILRPLDIKDHKIMSLEASSAFAALDSLGIENKRFRLAVKEFILRASLLAKIDQSISCNQSCQKLADRLNCQKLKLKEMRDTEAKVINALSVSKRCAAYLTEEISRLKDKLCKAEAELHCCQADSIVLESRAFQISKDKVKAEKSLRRMCDKLKNAWQLREQMEAEKHAAKAAFDEAKFLVWG